MKKLCILSALVFLAACEPSEEQKAHVRAVLPEGCTVYSLGNYGSISNLVAVMCDGRTTTTTNYSEPRGKTHVQQAVTVVN